MPEIKPDVLIFQVDFNNVDSEGRVKGTFAHAMSDRVPQQGEQVRLEDREGNGCWGVVAQVGSLTLRFRLELETWTSAEGLTAAGLPVASAISWSPAAVAA
jgi:hypothetical protein